MQFPWYGMYIHKSSLLLFPTHYWTTCKNVLSHTLLRLSKTEYNLLCLHKPPLLLDLSLQQTYTSRFSVFVALWCVGSFGCHFRSPWWSFLSLYIYFKEDHGEMCAGIVVQDDCVMLTQILFESVVLRWSLICIPQPSGSSTEVIISLAIVSTGGTISGAHCSPSGEHWLFEGFCRTWKCCGDLQSARQSESKWFQNYPHSRY